MSGRRGRGGLLRAMSKPVAYVPVDGYPVNGAGGELVREARAVSLDAHTSQLLLSCLCVLWGALGMSGGGEADSKCARPSAVGPRPLVALGRAARRDSLNLADFVGASCGVLAEFRVQALPPRCLASIP